MMSLLFSRRRHSTNSSAYGERLRRRQFRPSLESLEDRLPPATLLVSTTADSGSGSLRQAITTANSEPSGVADSITFSVTGTIQLATNLPDLSHAVNITGPGPNSLTVAGAAVGSVFTIDSGTVSISGLTVAQGHGSHIGDDSLGTDTTEGGGIRNLGTLTLDHCVITGNSAQGDSGMRTSPQGRPGQGGGIYNSGSLLLTNCIVSNNSATGGFGAGFTGSGGSGGAGLGGGIYSNGGSVTIVDSTLGDNQATGGLGGHHAAAAEAGGDAMGGGLYATGGAQIVIHNSTLSGNSAAGGKGGDGFTSPVTPVTAGPGGNAAGGALFIDSGSVAITSGTIAGNSAFGGPAGTGGPTPAAPGTGFAGGIDNAGGSVSLADTIVAGNAATSGNPDVQGAIHSNGFNLIQNPTGGSFSGGADLIADPLLGPLQNNGGPTPTRALLPGSPAIDSGDPNYQATGFDATDQRGFPRIVNGRVDIGAYEVQANEAAAGGGSTIAAAGPSVVFVVTANAGLMVHQGNAWTQIGGAGTITSISAVTGLRGDAAVFAVTTNQGLAEWDQFSGWRLVGGAGTIRLGSAGLDQNGQPDVFVITTTGALTEWSTTSGWLPSPIGASGTILSVSAVSGGGVYVTTTAESVCSYTPQSGWMSLSGTGFARTVSAAVIGSGQGTLFAVSGGNALFRFNSQTGWTHLGDGIQTISAGSNVSGQAELYALTQGDTFVHYNDASGWSAIGAPGTIRRFSATTAAYVFAITTDDAVAGYSPQTGWFSLSDAGFALA